MKDYRPYVIAILGSAIAGALMAMVQVPYNMEQNMETRRLLEKQKIETGRLLEKQIIKNFNFKKKDFDWNGLEDFSIMINGREIIYLQQWDGSYLRVPQI